MSLRVVAIMLTRDRPEMTARAVRSFEAQTYPHKRLLILDTGEESAGYFGDFGCVRHHWADLSLQSWTIGRLRNEAIRRAESSDLIAHWDSDDWSHPRRLEEQVALLESRGKACVGYRELVFWDTRTKVGLREITSGTYLQAHHDGESWVYYHGNPTMVVGASMLYRREAWESCAFSETEPAEDYHWWLRNVKNCLGVSAVTDSEPRMICGIHGGNTSGAYARDKMRPPEWMRAPEYDAYCAARMAL